MCGVFGVVHFVLGLHTNVLEYCMEMVDLARLRDFVFYILI